MIKVGVIGAVNSTAVTIKSLSEHGFDIVGVLGHEPIKRSMVSGWYDLRKLSVKLSIPFLGFQKINEKENKSWMKEKRPEVIFAVGFSQILDDAWLKISTLGCIGFHPTRLPKGRGRAPLAWLVLEERKGAATFFLMGKGADDGPIFIQEPFDLEAEDDAKTVQEKIHKSMKIALKKWLPSLMKGIWNPIGQSELDAAYYSYRGPTDSCIDWNQSSNVIDRLIKATTKPYPGAYTFFQGKKLYVWKSKCENTYQIKGVVGRVLLSDEEKGLLVQCGNGLLWIIEYSSEDSLRPKVSNKLGFNTQEEIYKIWSFLNQTKKQ